MKTNQQWLEDFRTKHIDKYDYSLMPYNVRSRTKFQIICPTHGIFNQSPTDHLRGTGCTECFRDKYRNTDEHKSQVKSERAHRCRESGMMAEQQRKHYHSNPHVKADKLKRNRHRYHATKNLPKPKAALLCRTLVQRTILASRGIKNMRTESMLGYTFEQFRQHIEAQFEDWMSWGNHGEWHVDHIKPIAVFISEGILDPCIINALDNLQPLSAAENLRKGDTV